MPVSGNNGRRLSSRPALLAPYNLARLQLDAGWKAIVVATSGINMIAHQDHAAMMILKFIRTQEVLLIDLDPATGGHQSE